MKKQTQKTRRMKRVRHYGTIFCEVARGDRQIDQELMQAITSPKWKSKIAEAAIRARYIGPDKKYRNARGSLRGTIIFEWPERRQDVFIAYRNLDRQEWQRRGVIRLWKMCVWLGSLVWYGSLLWVLL